MAGGRDRPPGRRPAQAAPERVLEGGGRPGVALVPPLRSACARPRGPHRPSLHRRPVRPLSAGADPGRGSASDVAGGEPGGGPDVPDPPGSEPGFGSSSAAGPGPCSSGLAVLARLALVLGLLALLVSLAVAVAVPVLVLLALAVLGVAAMDRPDCPIRAAYQGPPWYLSHSTLIAAS
jgi:hypothetical protein